MAKTATRVVMTGILALFWLKTAGSAGPDTRAATAIQGALPQAFRITPSRPASFSLTDIVYNPKAGLYVVFYLERSGRDYVYSRLYDARGRAKSSPQNILALDKYTITGLAAAYNAREDAFLLVGTDMTYKVINGLFLDGLGRLPAGTPKTVVIKPASGAALFMALSVHWLASVNQYAFAWTFDDFKNPASPHNGQYLAVLGRDGSLVLKPKLVKWQQMNQIHLASVAALPDKLVWGSSVDSTGKNVKPAVWLTDLKGRIISSVGVHGMIYPDGPVPATTHVWPIYDPDHERVLLHWVYEDGDPATFMENRYRIMDTRGRLRTGARAVPKREPYQMAGEVVYNPVEKRFFWACAEYKITHQVKPERWYYGGKIWGFYLDSDGHFEDKKGEDEFSPIPLTYTFLDPSKGMLFDRLVINSSDGSAFAAYELFRPTPGMEELWGLIYK